MRNGAILLAALAAGCLSFRGTTATHRAMCFYCVKVRVPQLVVSHLVSAFGNRFLRQIP